MNQSSKNPNYRRPVGGYGVESVNRRASITLPKHIDTWVMKLQSNFSKYVRGLILADYLRRKPKSPNKIKTTIVKSRKE